MAMASSLVIFPLVTAAFSCCPNASGSLLGTFRFYLIHLILLCRYYGRGLLENLGNAVEVGV